jgi:prepilin-type N-terminal cleavage/methylation domain-containing protein
MNTINSKNPKKGFTLVEVILAIVLICIIVPMGAVALGNIAMSVVQYQRLSQVVDLAQDYLTLVNNAPFSSLPAGTVTLPNYQGSGFTLRRSIVNLNLPSGSETDTEVLKRITVLASLPNTEVEVELETLRAKNVWFGIPSQGAPGTQAFFLVFSEAAATLVQKVLSGFSLQNTSPSTAITIDRMILVWSPIAAGQKLQKVVLNGQTGLAAGNVSSGALTDLTNIIFQPNQASTNNQFTFSKKFNAGTSVTFKLTFFMLDGSQKLFQITRVAK